MNRGSLTSQVGGCVQMFSICEHLQLLCAFSESITSSVVPQDCDTPPLLHIGQLAA